MATIQSTLKLNNQMSSTLSSITKAMHSTLSAMKSVKSENSSMGKAFDNAQRDIINTEKSLKSFNQEAKNIHNSLNNATGASNNFFKSLLGFGAVQKVFGLINSGVDSAIQRYDTLNNYTKVMSNLGISEEQAEASRARLSEGLKGLPTTLQDGVSAVQRFTAANKSIGASTEMFLALNNAILAGGGSAEIQASALEQVSQSYSKGKMDMMEWRALQQAMPAQLDQIAKAMGKSTTALGEGLRTGKIQMNDFMKTVVDLNKKGVGGFQSFEAQAKNATGGIGTSIANLKSAVTRGLTAMMDGINRGLASMGLGTISQVITNFGATLESVMSNVGNYIGIALTYLTPVFNMIKSIGSFVVDNWSIIAPIIMGIVAALIVYNTYIGIIRTVTAAWAAIQTVLNTVMMANPIMWIILAIVALVAIIGVVIAWINKVTGSSISAVGVIMGIIYTLGAFIMNTFVIPVWNALAMLVNFFANCFKNPVASVKILFAEMALNVLNRVKSMVEGIQSLINSIPGVEINITSGISGLISNIEQSVSKAKSEADYKEIMAKKEYMNYGDAYSKGYQKGSTMFKGTKTDTSTSKAIGKLDTSMDKLANTTGTDSTGGKAVKTTTKDKLFSDEDIQLLLDVATRDYKLNYQQITPNITLTFGDVHETADVDRLIDEVATKLEEIYDGNLEV